MTFVICDVNCPKKLITFVFNVCQKKLLQKQLSHKFGGKTIFGKKFQRKIFATLRNAKVNVIDKKIQILHTTTYKMYGKMNFLYKFFFSDF